MTPFPFVVAPFRLRALEPSPRSIRGGYAGVPRRFGGSAEVPRGFRGGSAGVPRSSAGVPRRFRGLPRRLRGGSAEVPCLFSDRRTHAKACAKLGKLSPLKCAHKNSNSLRKRSSSGHGGT